jgi:hypothetical protein
MNKAAGDFPAEPRAPSSAFEVATGDHCNDGEKSEFATHSLNVDTSNKQAPASADIDWLSPSLVRLTNRVMTRLAELSSSSPSINISACNNSNNKNTTKGLKTTGLLYNNNINSSEEEEGETSTLGQYYTYEVPHLEGGRVPLTPRQVTQDDMLMTQQLSGFQFQAETDMVLKSIASSLLSDSTASTIAIRQSLPDNNSTSAVARGHSHGSRDGEVGYDTDDDGMQGELAHLNSIAKQLRHDLDGATSSLLLPMIISVKDATEDEDVAQIAKHLKNSGLFQASDTMLITAENSMLVIFTFTLAIVLFFTRHGITEFQSLML